MLLTRLKTATVTLLMIAFAGAANVLQSDAPTPDPPKTFINSIGMKFVWIRPGRFLMGNTKEEIERRPLEILGPPPLEPQHKVALTRGFYMGIYPVTQTLSARTIRSLSSAMLELPSTRQDAYNIGGYIP